MNSYFFDHTHRAGERRLPPLPEIHQPGCEPTDLTDRNLRRGSAYSIDRCPLLRHQSGLGLVPRTQLGELRARFRHSAAGAGVSSCVSSRMEPIHGGFGI